MLATWLTRMHACSVAMFIHEYYHSMSVNCKYSENFMSAKISHPTVVNSWDHEHIMM